MKIEELFGEGLTGYSVKLDVFDANDLKTQVNTCIKLIDENKDKKGRIYHGKSEIVDELLKLMYFCDNMTSGMTPRETNDLFSPREVKKESTESVISNDYSQSHLQKSHEDIFDEDVSLES